MTNTESLILIVDDSKVELKILEKFLKYTGYQLALAKNANEALDFLQTEIPDLILLDIVMPKMNGIELCQYLKTQDRTMNIPVIFLTGLSDTQSKLEAFQVGGVDYVTKPFIQEEVLARINVHIRLQHAIKQLEQIAVTDEMTGAFNRRFAYEILSKQIHAANREKSLFSICYIDVDNLKTINDNYGHDQGDNLINTVVNYIKNTIRASDYIFRMGGDEFLVIFRNSGIKDSCILMEKIRNHLNHKKICDLAIDFSFGCSEFKAGDQILPEELIKIADSRMFEAKKQKKKNKLKTIPK